MHTAMIIDFPGHTKDNDAQLPFFLLRKYKSENSGHCQTAHSQYFQKERSPSANHYHSGSTDIANCGLSHILS